MKLKAIYLPVIAAFIMASCTTTLQERSVSDELYNDPQFTREENMAYSGDSKDRLYESNDTLREKNYDNDRRYYGSRPYPYYPHYHDWFYRDFYPFHSPLYGYGYPWYNPWYGFGPAFYGVHYYGYYPYYAYSWYNPWYGNYYYPGKVRNIQRKSASFYSNNLPKNAGATERIRKITALPENKSVSSSDIRKSSNSGIPLRTIRARSVSGNRNSNLAKPIRIRKATPQRKYNVANDHRQINFNNHPVRKRSPVYRQPSHSVNRSHSIRSRSTGSSSSRRRK
jgi:hypothetical protein